YLLLLDTLREHGRLRRPLGELRPQRRQLLPARDEPAERETRQLVLPAAEGQRHVVVEGADLLLVSRDRLAEALLLLAHGLEPRPLLIEGELGLPQVLLQEERTLLQRFDELVGVGLEQRRDAIEELHGRVLHPVRQYLLPGRRAS